MRYSKEERIEMGRIIHESGLSNLYAGLYLGIGEETARNYRILYERSKGIRHKSNRKKEETIDEIKAAEELENSISGEKKYTLMTKDELIEELMKLKAECAVLKKKGEIKKNVKENISDDDVNAHDFIDGDSSICRSRGA